MRRSGQTTRLIDQYVQQLFASPGERLMIVDHHEGGRDYHANKHLLTILDRRIKSEHGQEVELRVRWEDKTPLAWLNRLK